MLNNQVTTVTKPPVINKKDAALAHRKLSALLMPWARNLIIMMYKYGEMNVTELQVKYRSEYEQFVEQPEMSNWLVRLRHSGILSQRRSGKWVYYTLSESELMRIGRISHALAKFYNPRIKVYGREVAHV